MNGSRQHAIICYSIDSIEAIKLFASHVTYIVHDKDKNKDGSLKKTHYHVLAYTDNQKTSSAFYKNYRKAMVRHTNDKDYFDREQHDDIKAQYVKDTGDVIDYLCHDKDDTKYHYDINDVQGDFDFWKKNIDSLREQLKEEKEDWTISLLELIILQNNKITRAQLVDVLKKHGRDAIFNLRRVLDSLSVCVDFKIVDKLDNKVKDDKGRELLIDKNGEVRAAEIGGSNPFED